MKKNTFGYSQVAPKGDNFYWPQSHPTPSPAKKQGGLWKVGQRPSSSHGKPGRLPRIGPPDAFSGHSCVVGLLAGSTLEAILHGLLVRFGFDLEPVLCGQFFRVDFLEYVITFGDLVVQILFFCLAL